jgi:hypothetical protein
MVMCNKENLLQATPAILQVVQRHDGTSYASADCRMNCCAQDNVPASLYIPLKLYSIPTHGCSMPIVWNEYSNRRKFICPDPKLNVAASSGAPVGDVPEAPSAESGTVRFRDGAPDEVTR